MIHYTRNDIIKSQIHFGNFLNADIINKLIHLFDEKYNNYVNKNHKITKYIENERKIEGLDSNNVKILSYVYGETKENSTLFLQIKKNNKDFIHLTIHLIPRNLNPDLAGIIHIDKNIYKIKSKNKIKNKSYALIYVNRPINKQRSLEFSIADGYTTLGVTNANKYDSEIQKEMNIIITVLNRLFDEDNQEYYIGNKNIIYPIHNKTNLVLNNINKHTSLITRKNKGIKMYPNRYINNNIIIRINKDLRKTRKTRK
jgi:hypothetical protein